MAMAVAADMRSWDPRTHVPENDPTKVVMARAARRTFVGSPSVS
jgi:hypothetical protein